MEFQSKSREPKYSIKKNLVLKKEEHYFAILTKTRFDKSKKKLKKYQNPKTVLF